jgi:hypothetical protein
MSHAVFVKHLNAQGGANPEILAYDIDSSAQAERLAAALASSYPLHGVYSDTRRAWFSDGCGLHEIWAQAI